MNSSDTIAAPATAAGRAGIGIIRISGPNVASICQSLCGQLPKARYAQFVEFLDADNDVIDKGLILYFPKPHSFTGEDVLECHGHGGIVVMNLLLQRILSLGARIARPGEFSERAFLNNKIDLTQAEAIADLIDASSREAVRAAVHSLEGVFSTLIHDLVEKLIQLRLYIEAAMDFPEEEIDFLSEGHVEEKCQEIINDLEVIQSRAKQGVLLRDGMTVVIAGSPNAGKSSLLNQLSERDSAIVTDIPGTTRDLLREHIQIDGLPLQIIDTAGLRESDDLVEKEGIRRAEDMISKADRVLYLVDIQTPSHEIPSALLEHPRLTFIYNKIDLVDEVPEQYEKDGVPVIKLSAKTGRGIDLLRKHLKSCMGFRVSNASGFSARQRHLNAIEQAKNCITSGLYEMKNHRTGELLAEELRLAQQHLGEITGEFSSEDLLGRIFQQFCIGK